MRRSKLEIIVEILKISSLNGGANVTKIVYRANLNFKTAQEYISYLVKNDFLVEIPVKDRKKYATTGKGREFIKRFEAVETMM